MSNTHDSLIVYLVPPEKIVNGGVLSIFSMAKESRKLKKIHNSEVVLCTYVGYETYHTNDLFENDEYVYSFDEITKKFPHVKKMIINVPELAVVKLSNRLAEYTEYMKQVADLHINILNQNILYMPTYSNIFSLYKYTDHITQTTAHNKYSSQEISNTYCLPLKHLSVFIDSKQYDFKSYSNKENLIAYSKDEHPKKQAVLELIAKRAPEYTLLEISGVKYEEYKKIISRAKFVITFGEGFDGYLIESTFSGSVPLAVYNEDFFPSEAYKDLQGIYKSYDDMILNIVNDLKILDTPIIYTKSNQKLFKMLNELYGSDIYRSNLSKFYNGQFDYMPNPAVCVDTVHKEVKNLFHSANKDALRISELEKNLQNHKVQLLKYQEAHKRKVSELDAIYGSTSWKIAQFLRRISGKA